MNVGNKICFFILIFQNTEKLIRKLEHKYKGKIESDKSIAYPTPTLIQLLTW
jgi:hypothetical protein